MLDRAPEVLWRLYRAAARIKTLSEWLLIAGWLGVPGASALIAFSNGQPLDVVFLYLMAGVAFWYVIRVELNVQRTAQPAAQTAVVVFESPACHDCACSVAPEDVDFRVRIGVLNAGMTTLRNVQVFLVSLLPGFKAKRSLRWVGEPPGASIDLKPSTDHHHVELFSRRFDSSDGNEYCFLSVAEPYLLKEELYDAALSVEADDMPPMHVDLKVDPRARPWVTISSPPSTTTEAAAQP
ncbi:MAG TPA: hypothetical protein VJO34_09700 [Methylomirabilota bacterium]|nr:hypothetical protein [Methylomirabilota bacterium]